ncbi:DegV family protein [Syntrophomonas erecta]
MGPKIITDTSCDLPDKVLDQYGIEMIPLRVTFENGETYRDRFDLPPEVFVKKMAAFKTLPKTAAPDPVSFAKCFERGLREKGEVIFISLSSGLSSTYNTALLAANMLDTGKVKVFDTLNASLGTGIMAVRAAQMAAQGMPIDSITPCLETIRHKSLNIFTLDTLENVVKGGRLNPIEGLAGNLLNIKPILRGDESGKPEVIEKVRGRKRAITHMVDIISEKFTKPLADQIVGISHVNCGADAHLLAEKIESCYHPDTIWVSEMSATIGTYAGEGALMINV